MAPSFIYMRIPRLADIKYISEDLSTKVEGNQDSNLGSLNPDSYQYTVTVKLTSKGVMQKQKIKYHVFLLISGS